MKKITFAVAACAMFAFAACSNTTETTGSDSATNDSNVEVTADDTLPKDTLPKDTQPTAAPEAPAAH